MLQKYTEYQQRYADQIRESDKVLLSMIKQSIEGRSGKPALLDIGCSTGNLLLHIQNAFPHLELIGADLAVKFVEECRVNPKLAGMSFEVMNMLDIPADSKFDVIVANAVTQFFNFEEYDQAIRSVMRALKPGGWYLSFEWLHGFEQDLEIKETSQSHPNGLKIFARPFHKVEAVFKQYGSAEIEFRPFQIPIDLVRGTTYGENREGYQNLNSYTVKAETGERLLFRGALFQPWCHLRAQKAP